MIKMKLTGSRVPARAVIDYLENEHDLGTLSYHRDGTTFVFNFYNPEDEAVFILKFGNSFCDDDSYGYYFCPYIPAGLK